MSRLLKRLQAIEELDCVLQNWCNDDGKQPEDYTATELLELATQRRSEFFEDGHVFYEALAGDLGLEEKKYAKSQLAKIDRFIQSAKKVQHA
jgi:hypothetical protein